MNESQKSWLVEIQPGEIGGPFSSLEIIRGLESGKWTDSTKCRRVGNEDWMTLGDVDDWREGAQALAERIRFKCDCGEEIVMAGRFAGRRAKCSVCGQVLTVPTRQSPPLRIDRFRIPRKSVVVIPIIVALFGFVCWRSGDEPSGASIDPGAVHSKIPNKSVNSTHQNEPASIGNSSSEPLKQAPAPLNRAIAQESHCPKHEYVRLANALNGHVRLYVESYIASLINGEQSGIPVPEVRTEFAQIARDATDQRVARSARAAAFLWRSVPEAVLSVEVHDPVSLALRVLLDRITDIGLGEISKIIDRAQEECWNSIDVCAEEIWANVEERDNLVTTKINSVSPDGSAVEFVIQNTSGKRLSNVTTVIEFRSIANIPSINAHYFFEEMDAGAVESLAYSPRLRMRGALITSASVRAWSDEAAQPAQIVEFPSRLPIVESFVKRVELINEGRAHLEELFDKGVQLEGCWYFGKFKGRIGMEFVRISGSRRRSPDTIRLYDPDQPAVYKEFQSSIAYDGANERFTIEFAPARNSGISASKPRIIETETLLRRSDHRRISLWRHGASYSGKDKYGLAFELHPKGETVELARLWEATYPEYELTDSAAIEAIPAKLLPTGGTVQPKATPIVGEQRRWDALPNPLPVMIWPTISRIVVKEDATRLAWRKHRELVVWDLSNNTEVYRASNRGFEMSRDWAFVARGRYHPHKVEIANSEPFGPDRIGHVHSFTLTPEGQFVSGNGNGEISVWNDDGKAVSRVTQTGRADIISVNSGGERLFATTPESFVNCWYVESGEYVGQFRGANQIVALYPGSTGERVLLVEKEGKRRWLRIFDATSQETLYLDQIGVTPTMVSISDDWRSAIIAEPDCRVRYLDLTEGVQKLMFTGHYDEVTAGYVSTAHRRAWTGDKDGWVIEWALGLDKS